MEGACRRTIAVGRVRSRSRGHETRRPVDYLAMLGSKGFGQQDQTKARKADATAVTRFNRFRVRS